MIRALRERGHRLSVVALASSAYGGGLTEAEHLRHLRDLGIDVEILTDRMPTPRRNLRRILAPKLVDLFPGAALRDSLAARLEELRPDAVVAYHWDAIAAAHGVREA